MLRFRLHFLPEMPKLELRSKVRWEILHAFYWKFTSLSSSERVLKIREELTVIAMSFVYYFLGTQCRV